MSPADAADCEGRRYSDKAGLLVEGSAPSRTEESPHESYEAPSHQQQYAARKMKPACQDVSSGAPGPVPGHQIHRAHLRFLGGPPSNRSKCQLIEGSGKPDLYSSNSFPHSRAGSVAHGPVSPQGGTMRHRSTEISKFKDTSKTNDAAVQAKRPCRQFAVHRPAADDAIIATAQDTQRLRFCLPTIARAATLKFYGTRLHPLDMRRPS